MEKINRFFTGRLVSLLLRVGLPAALLYAVFQMVPLDHVVQAFASADLLTMGLGVVLVVPAFAIRIHFWHLLLNSDAEHASWKESTASFLVGQSFGFITPGGLGDFVIRGTAVKHIPVRRVIGWTVLDNALMFLLVSATGLTAFVAIFVHGYLRFVLAAAIVLAFGIAWIYVSRLVDATVRLVHKIPFLASLTKDVHEAAIASPATLIVCLGSGLLFLLLEYFQVFVIVRAFTEASFIDVAVAYAAVLFIKFAVPFAAGDLGVREISTVYLFSLVGISESAALNASLIHFLSNNILPALVGGWLFVHTRASQKIQPVAEEPATP